MQTHATKGKIASDPHSIRRKVSREPTWSKQEPFSLLLQASTICLVFSIREKTYRSSVFLVMVGHDMAGTLMTELNVASESRLLSR